MASGVAYALAGPNDRTYTATTDYRLERYSAFESARQAARQPDQRRALVYGDDSRAWDDINRLEAAGVGVGTFDIRNYYSPYVPRLQLDGLAGAAISGRPPGAVVARQLKSRDIDAVFVPSWFWEPGASPPSACRSISGGARGSVCRLSGRFASTCPTPTSPTRRSCTSSDPRSSATATCELAPPIAGVLGRGSPLDSKDDRPRRVRDLGLLGGPLHWRIAAPVTEIGGPSIRLTTRDVGRGSWRLRLRAEGTRRSSTRQRSSIAPASQRGRGRARST